MYDIIIVGGGAIGLYLAGKFAEKGSAVLLIERRKKIGGKPCSGLVSSQIFEFINRNDCNFIESEFSKARVWVEEKSFDFKGRALLLNREGLDKYLFKKAREAGANIQLNKEVIKIKEREDKVELLLKSGEEIRGKIIAGCDGAISKVAQELNLPEQKNLLLGVIGYESKNRREDFNNNFPELFFSRNFPGFFVWKIPRNKNIEWGIALEPKKKPREKLDKFLEDKRVKIERMESALIPISSRKKTVTKRCLLCGDAAGQVKPATGGGLIYGFIAARVASRMINSKKNTTLLYERGWRKELQKEIIWGRLFQKCYYLPNFIKKIGLFWLKNKKNLNQDRPSTIFTL